MSLKTNILSALFASTALVAMSPSLWADQAKKPVEDDAETQASEGQTSKSDDTIVVTGTRIRGARVVGEVTTLDRDAIVDAGQVDLGEALRSLPQNFSGGQNPGVGIGAGLINSNTNAASTANLRGLGPDATLTLLNGHRLPYDSAISGVDISAIPLAAIDRIEIVPDGASALYGSDAVAGVVNVILRRDFDGVETSGQLGASTSGGYFRQQADIVAGTGWDGGGFFVAYDYAHNSDIAASQRSYTASLYQPTSLYPSQRRHALTISAHHSLAPGIELSVDAHYSNRRSTQTGGTAAFRSFSDPEVESYSIAPSASFALGSRWRATLQGVFGRDRTRFRTTFTPQAGAASTTTGCLCNDVVSMEIGAEGPLFDLPGGAARLALGAGFRNNGLDYSRIQDGSPFITFDEEQRARFAYGELFLPFISAENGIGGVAELSLSAAVRYEDYKALDRLATPRIGLIYSPIKGLTFRGSWARSFKAPTLFQQYAPYQAILLPAAVFGAGSGAQTVFYTSGGNPDAQPERARSWTAGFELRPTSIPELTVSATWYDIRYRDRVTRPIAGSIGAAFRDPGYASLIDFSPSASALSDLIAGAQFGLENFAGAPYDFANVVAYLDNRNINVAVWAIEGIDARISWNQDFGADKSLAFEVAGSWIDRQQQLTAALPDIQLAGSVYNPPRYSGRATARFQSGGFSANLALNYIGALVDRRFAQAPRIDPSATLDLGLSYDILGGKRSRPGLLVSLTVQNVFDDEPQVIAMTEPTVTPYDSTNYSPIGRFIALGIRRAW